tara:strand:+ start:2372 stop:3283 length:912 start_codon:yes stop_codon:yes gene_type:complete
MTVESISEPQPTMDLKERCNSSSPVSYEAVEDSPSHYSPSPYCQCIMDGFENPGDDELIFSNFNIPEKITCGDRVLQKSFGNTISDTCGDEDIPDLSNIGSVGYTTGIQLDNNVSDTYLQSMTNLYNTKLNKDSEILSSYIRCKEESYKPIINQFRDNATVITDFITQNQDSISRILSNGKIDSIINKTSDILSATPASDVKTAIDVISAVPASDVKETIDKINNILDNDNINSVIDKTDDILSAVPTSEITDAMGLVKELADLFSPGWKIVLWIIFIFLLFLGYFHLVKWWNSYQKSPKSSS